MASERPRPTTRAFLDSSVLIAASISSTGAGRELIVQGIRGAIQLFISPLVLEETERNLQRKAPAALPMFLILRQALAKHSVTPSASAVREASKLIAAKDAPIVAAARRARATYLATYDQKDLLSQREVIATNFGVLAVFPDEVLKLLRSQGSSPS